MNLCYSMYINVLEKELKSPEEEIDIHILHASVAMVTIFKTCKSLFLDHMYDLSEYNIQLITVYDTCNNHHPLDKTINLETDQ